ncbi:MAG: deoxyribonuclease V [Sandaracinaceae bacterium]|nr:deoxyribonuclease V [Sandaracinaceae bacterium]
MRPVLVPQFDLTQAEAAELQRELAGRVVSRDALGPVRTVAGADVAYEKNGERLFAAIVVLDATTLAVVDQAAHVERARFPYVPGLFSFRELPPLLECAHKLRVVPDLFVCDGQGRAHPRRFGLACHLGVLFDVPAIGCAKQSLVGSHGPLGASRGSIASIVDGGEVVGAALRTQDGVQPVFVSVGHRVALETACQLILRFANRYRLPETTRQADQLVNRLRRAA